MGSMEQAPTKPWVETPCYQSAPLSRAAGCNIFLKLDNLQPSGSFKSRGVGNLMQQAIESHGPSRPIRFYCSSGGNAGLACITAARSLNRPATIVVPYSTSNLMIIKLKTLGADVHQVGANWAEADTFLREQLLNKDDDGVYVPPFDHQDIWTGNSSLIEELDRQIEDYDAIVCSVGGGGLFCGIIEGLDNRKYGKGKTVQVLAVETKGADSLTKSILENRHIKLPAIDSIAFSLGCVKVAERTFKLAQERNNVTCLALSDAEAAMGCVRFADEERFLIEVSCGVSVATIYGGHLRKALGKSMSDEEWSHQRIVIEICGGSGVSLGILEGYRKKYSDAPELQRQTEAESMGIEER